VNPTEQGQERDASERSVIPVSGWIFAWCLRRMSTRTIIVSASGLPTANPCRQIFIVPSSTKKIERPFAGHKPDRDQFWPVGVGTPQACLFR
jgi:hypothetical protein